MTTYVPKPQNVDGISVPEKLTPLAEKIAEHVHDVWAVGRIKDGWVYGPKRDDDLKHHPCLLPYVDLPDSEREYDRNTADATIKLIIASDFVISKK